MQMKRVDCLILGYFIWRQLDKNNTKMEGTGFKLLGRKKVEAKKQIHLQTSTTRKEEWGRQLECKHLNRIEEMSCSGSKFVEMHLEFKIP